MASCVDVSTSEGSAPNKIKANVEVTERPTGTFQVGAGFSSIENFIATAQVQQANLFGNGQMLALNAQVSGIRQLVNLRYFEPYFLDSPFNFTTELFDMLRAYKDFSQSTIGGSLTFGYPIVDLSDDWTPFIFAGKLKGQPRPVATQYYQQQPDPFAHFGYLVRAIEYLVRTGHAPYPVERTLLTTGLLDAIMTSKAEKNRRVETPHLAVGYRAADWPFATDPVPKAVRRPGP